MESVRHFIRVFTLEAGSDPRDVDLSGNESLLVIKLGKHSIPFPIIQSSMKARIAAIAVISLLTLAVIAVGFSAVGQTRDAAAATDAAATAMAQDGEDNPAVSTFKFVCPFH